MRPPVKLSPAASTVLDLLRGIAAFEVLLAHVSALAQLDVAALGHRPSLFVRLLYVAMGGGHSSVIVFFVLSGFLVGGSGLRALSAGRWSLGDYAIDRAVRLSIVLWPALALGGVLDAIGRAAFHDGAFAASATYRALFDGTIAEHFTVRAFLASATYQMRILGPIFGSNGALWSLAPEAFYYLLFAALVESARRSTAASRRFAARVVLVATLAYVAALAPWLLSGLAYWILGAALTAVPARAWVLDARAWRALRVGAAVSLVGAGLAFGRVFPSLPADPVVAGATAMLIGLVVYGPPPRVRAGGILEQIAGASARLSYSLYVVHLPFLVFVFTVVQLPARTAPSMAGVASCAGLVALCVACAQLFWFAFERRTHDVRAWAKRKLRAASRARG